MNRANPRRGLGAKADTVDDLDLFEDGRLAAFTTAKQRKLNLSRVGA